MSESITYKNTHCPSFPRGQLRLSASVWHGSCVLVMLLIWPWTSLESGKEQIPLVMGAHPGAPSRDPRMPSQVTVICKAFDHKGRWSQRVSMGERWDREGFTRDDVNALT